MTIPTQNPNKRFSISLKQFRCGSCAGLGRKFPGYKFNCADEGIMPTSKACQWYTPDYSQLAFHAETINPVLNLVEAIRNTPVTLLPHLAYLMISAERIQRFLDGKYALLQKVYYKYRGAGDYLSNYCWAYIINADVDGMTLLGKSGEMIIRTDWSCAKSSVFSEDDFEVLREGMVANRMLYDPELDEHAKRIVRASMRLSATKERPEGEVDVESAVGSGEVNTQLVEKANLADLFAELSTKGTVGGTHDKEVWKTVLDRRRELKGTTAEADSKTHYAFGHNAEPDDEPVLDVGVRAVVGSGEEPEE